MVEEDPFLWLEDVTSDAALEWIHARNAETLEELTCGERFEQIRAEIRAVLDVNDRIPQLARHGGYFYNFWKDTDNPRGLWRRVTLEEYRKDRPEWEVLIDLDALAKAEGENWVWRQARMLRPDYQHGLIELSRGGADAVVVREFDIERRVFIEDGFVLPEAKSRVSWINVDTIYVGTDFGEGSLTTSKYPRFVKEWRRGTSLEMASTVYEGKPEDFIAVAYHDSTPGFERSFVESKLDYWRVEKFLRTDDGLIRIDVPEDSEISVHREWLIIRTRSPWTVNDHEYKAGTLLATHFDDYLAGSRELTVLFEPDAHTSLEEYVWTQNHLILTTLSDVRTKLYVLTPAEGWRREPMSAGSESDTAWIMATDPDNSDEYLLVTSGFTEPSALKYGHIGGKAEVLKQSSAQFDAKGMTVDQHFATSPDGTQIPYFVVRPQEVNGPTLLYGYGGFESSELPNYSGAYGRGWLARGGTYVLANIRGGGEYGPSWHTQAVKENRYLVYEDFAAVAKDLIDKGITTREKLGAYGDSNGGLLMGVMLTEYPQLFGAIICDAPLLDMRRYHKLLAGAAWMAEYGDPDDPEQWKYIGKHSPYQNIYNGRNYPPALFISSTRDDRVHPAHARKMVAKMRTQGHDVRYYENAEGGHAGAGNGQRAQKWALLFEFLWSKLEH